MFRAALFAVAATIGFAWVNKKFIHANIPPYSG